jgi:glycosyltransferase involved in cell wall biosynthesis
MRILLVAPNPFFLERGTPIAVRMLCETLCEAGHAVDLLTYHVGRDVDVPGLTIHRIPAVPFIRFVPIGFSWKKVVCDAVLSVKLFSMVARNRYAIIHAVEESVFPALIARRLSRGARLIYDMDSSLADQLLEKWKLLAPLGPLLRALERFAIRRSDGIVAVCDDLAIRARACAPDQRVTILRDVPLESKPDGEPAEDLRAAHGIRGLLMLYVGNLEHYQGIDLLLEAFALAQPDREVTLVLIGGEERHVTKYAAKAGALGIADRVRFLGPRSVGRLGEYLRQATILASPRLTGNNTPMKVYSYLASGKPVLATNISAHTQVMDDSCAVLVDPVPAAMARGIERLAADEALRNRLGAAAEDLAREKYSVAVFRKTVSEEYSDFERRFAPVKESPFINS